MKTQIRFLVLVLTIFVNVNQVIAETKGCRNTPVEVTEVKDLGLSDADETKSVIEVQWCVNPTLQPTHSAFNVTLEITYADGAILIFDKQAENSSRSAEVEVPTLHIYRGKKPAVIKQMKAFVTTEVLN